MDYQVDIGSAQYVKAPKSLLVTQKAAAGIGVPNKGNNTAVFDNLFIRKCFSEIDGDRYHKDMLVLSMMKMTITTNIGIVNYFYDEYTGEELLSPLKAYTDLKNFYPIQLLELRFQVDNLNPKKIQLFEEYKGAIKNAKYFVIILRHRDFEMLLEGKKSTEYKVTENDTLFEKLHEETELKKGTKTKTDVKKLYRCSICRRNSKITKRKHS